MAVIQMGCILRVEQAGDKLPEPTLAVFAEGLVISRASLKSLKGDAHTQRSFCPESVIHFAWPVLDFITVDR